MITEYLTKRAEFFLEILKELRKDSDYYPSVLLREYENDFYVSTFARVEHEGLWYKVHCVEYGTPSDFGAEVNRANVLLRLMRAVHFIQHCYVIVPNIPNPPHEVDELQISEVERLKKLNAAAAK